MVAVRVRVITRRMPQTPIQRLVSGPEMPGKRVGVLTSSSYATHARASLVETLGTMSARVVADAVRVLPLDGRRIEAAEIVADPELSGILRDALSALNQR